MKVQFETQNAEDVAHARALLGQLGPGTGHSSMDLDALSAIFAMQRERKKIQCIKLIREVYGLGLKEAKEWVEDNLRM